MIITIDPNAGFCPGVRKAIRKADKQLEEEARFSCIGALLHNDKEMRRLEDKGLKVIENDDLPQLKGSKVLFRAHGEPPETYDKARDNDVEVVDATCAVVKKLQLRVAEAAEEMMKKGGQVVIFGKKDHPEVIGLVGNSKGLAVVVSSLQDLGNVNMDKPIRLFSQTTMDDIAFKMIADSIRDQHDKKAVHPDFVEHNTICKYVLNRVPALKEFASRQEVIIFVSGRESSNGKKLYRECKAINRETYFLSDPNELKEEWIRGKEKVGISGSASTPQWLMEEVASRIKGIE